MLAVLALSASTGCDDQRGDVIRQVQQERDDLARKNERLGREVVDRDDRIADLEAQVRELLRLGPDRLADLFVVERIDLASLTGGADYDGVPGDDGVTVYLRPLDADGHVIKAAGEISIELLDTSEPGSPRSLGRCVYDDPEQLRRLWHGGLLTNHYTIRCPWGAGVSPPASRAILIQATFLDFLTGRRLSAARQVRVSISEGGARAGG